MYIRSKTGVAIFTFSISIENPEYKKIEKYLEKHNLQESPFIKDCVISHIENDPENLEGLGEKK